MPEGDALFGTVRRRVPGTSPPTARQLRVKVCFLINDLGLAGGTGVVIEHAHQLNTHHGVEVTIALGVGQREPWRYERLDGVRVASLAELRAERFDVAVACWWRSAYDVLQIAANRYAYFVQSLEDRFYERFATERLAAGVTHSLPVAYITEAAWIRDLLLELMPDAPVHYVRNGIDKDVFPVVESVGPSTNGPLRVLIEGHPDVWYKGVRESLDVLALMTQPHRATLVTPDRDAQLSGLAQRHVGPLSQQEMAREYTEHHVLLKMSRVEGVYGPPLEAFHRGATVVTTPVTGHDEYVEHARNGLVADWDDPRGTARLLDLLAHDRSLLERLRGNAVETARAWPSWRQAGDEMAAALGVIVETSMLNTHVASARMLGDVMAGTLELRLRRDQLEQEVRRLHADVLRLHGEVGEVVEQVDDLHAQLMTRGDELGDVVRSERWRLGGEMEQIIRTRRGRLMRLMLLGRRRELLAEVNRLVRGA